MRHSETATAGRKPIALAHKTHSTSGVRVTNANAWARLRRNELTIRIDTLSRNIYRHEFNPDFRRSLKDWRVELLEAKLELSCLRLP